MKFVRFFIGIHINRKSKYKKKKCFKTNFKISQRACKYKQYSWAHYIKKRN